MRGIRRRSAASASRARVSSFSLTSSSSRAAFHSCGETTGGRFISVPPSGVWLLIAHTPLVDPAERRLGTGSERPAAGGAGLEVVAQVHRPGVDPAALAFDAELAGEVAVLADPGRDLDAGGLAGPGPLFVFLGERSDLSDFDREHRGDVVLRDRGEEAVVQLARAAGVGAAAARADPVVEGELRELAARGDVAEDALVLAGADRVEEAGEVMGDPL